MSDEHIVDWDTIKELLNKVEGLSSLISFAGGYFSLCWEPKPTGVFDSDRAVRFSELVTDVLQNKFGASLVSKDFET